MTYSSFLSTLGFFVLFSHHIEDGLAFGIQNHTNFFAGYEMMRYEICLEFGRSLRPTHGPWTETKTKENVDVDQWAVDGERQRDREHLTEALGCAYVVPTYIVCVH